MHRQKDKQLINKLLLTSKVKKGFTLAEVLLVITIVGIIASYTVPDLVMNVTKMQRIVAAKKTYSAISNAVNSVREDNNGTLKGMTGDSFYQALLSKFSVIHVFDRLQQGNTESFYMDVHFLDGTNTNPALGSYNFQLIDGAIIGTSYSDATCTANLGYGVNYFCGLIKFDINGAKSPNTLGEDIFFVFITNDGIKPYGMYMATNDCLRTNANSGWNCMIKILTDEDY